MLVMGLEPIRSCPRQILSLLRLPFRHTSNILILSHVFYFGKMENEIYRKGRLHQPDQLFPAHCSLLQFFRQFVSVFLHLGFIHSFHTAFCAAFLLYPVIFIYPHLDKIISHDFKIALKHLHFLFRKKRNFRHILISSVVYSNVLFQSTEPMLPQDIYPLIICFLHFPSLKATESDNFVRHIPFHFMQFTAICLIHGFYCSCHQLLRLDDPFSLKK